MTTQNSPRLLFIFALLNVYTIWGSTYLGIYFALRGFPPFLLAGLRFVLAGILFLLWAAAKKEIRRPTRIQLRNTAITGFLMLCVSNGLNCIAIKTVPTGVTAIVITSVPIFATLFSRLWGNKTSPLEWGGIGVGIAGVIILNIDASMPMDFFGIFLLLLSSACWAFTSIWLTRMDMPQGKISSALQMLFGGIALLTLSGLFAEKLPATIPWEAIAALFYLITFGSIVGYTSYIYVLQHSGPAMATSYAYVNPIVAIILGAIFAGEMVNASILLAMVVILSGVGLIAWGQARKRGGKL